MRRSLACAVAAAALWGAAASAQVEGPVEIRRLSDGAAIAGVAGLAEMARARDLVVFGEIHDNARHQRLQAELARALGAPPLAFEMIPRDVEAALAELRASRAAPDAEAREAARWDEYPAWHVVLEAAPASVVAGAGLSRETIRAAIADGAAAAFPGDPARWGLDVAPPADVQAEVEAEMADAHCGALPATMLPGFAEAQRLRDAAFAEALLRARDAGGEGAGPAMLITGNGHARRDRGAPAFLAVAAPELSVLSILTAERAPGDADWRDAAARWEAEGRFDVIAVTDPADRGDPCERFRAAPAD